MPGDGMHGRIGWRSDEALPRTVGRLQMLVSAMAVAIGTAMPAWATGVTERVSLGPGAAQSKSGSDTASISADGRFVVFESGAPLVPDDTNNALDVFVRTLVP